MKFTAELILIGYKSHSFLALGVRNKEIGCLHFPTHSGLYIYYAYVAVKSTLSEIFTIPRQTMTVISSISVGV